MSKNNRYGRRKIAGLLCYNAYYVYKILTSKEIRTVEGESWVCTLCGCFGGIFDPKHPDYKLVGCSCCPACGMSCLRPWREFTKRAKRRLFHLMTQEI